MTAGDSDFDFIEPAEIEIELESIHIHPGYKLKYDGPCWRVFHHDVAVLKLKSPIPLHDIYANKEAICLPKTDSIMIWNSTDCYTYGFGVTESAPGSRYLRDVKVPIVPLQLCNKPNAYNKSVDTQNLCAGYYQVGYSACKGDSGSSLVCNWYGRWFQLGVVSSGKLPCLQHEGDYGLYTNIVKNVNWILKTVLAT